VRAADNPVCHHGGAGWVRLKEDQNLLTDGGIMAYVQVALGEPAFEETRCLLKRKQGNKLAARKVYEASHGARPWDGSHRLERRW
jgi:hypothetical protein